MPMGNFCCNGKKYVNNGRKYVNNGLIWGRCKNLKRRGYDLVRWRWLNTLNGKFYVMDYNYQEKLERRGMRFPNDHYF